MPSAAYHASRQSAVNRTNPTPIYRQIAELIKQRINGSEFVAEQRLPSNRQLAEEFKVNHLTVRQALKLLQEDGVIDIAHGRGAFVLSDKPLRLKTALVLPSLGQEQSGYISSAVKLELGSGATVDVMDYHNRPAEELACLTRIRKEDYNSAIVYPSLQGESVRCLLQMIVEGFPVVLVDRTFGMLPACSVMSDNVSGGYLATRHLLSRKCRRIACFTTTLPNVEDRLDGYRRALGEYGIAFDEKLVVSLSVDGDVTEDATEKFLARNGKPDGVFYYNDYQALVGIKQLKKAGLRIPEDVQVVGFDNLDIGKFSAPALSTVRQNHEEVGREAVRLLQEIVRLQPNQRLIRKTSLVPVELMVRESSQGSNSKATRPAGLASR